MSNDTVLVNYYCLMNNLKIASDVQKYLFVGHDFVGQLGQPCSI